MKCPICGNTYVFNEGVKYEQDGDTIVANIIFHCPKCESKFISPEIFKYDYVADPIILHEGIKT